MGYVAAIMMGFVLPTTGVTADGVEFTKAWVLNWDKVAQASWFAIPKLVPVKIVFDLRAILPVMVMFIVTAVETVGDISGVMEGGMNREPSDKRAVRRCHLRRPGLHLCRLLWRATQHLVQPERRSGVAMTKVVNRGALATGAVFLILCGLIPKLGALVSIMPQAVLGGAAVMMFSSIVVSGIQLITKEDDPAHLTIVSVALGVGYGMGANSSILAHTPQAISSSAVSPASSRQPLWPSCSTCCCRKTTKRNNYSIASSFCRASGVSASHSSSW